MGGGEGQEGIEGELVSKRRRGVGEEGVESGTSSEGKGGGGG